MEDELTTQLGKYVLERINQIATEQVEQKTKVKKITLNLKGLAAMTGMSESYLRDNVIDTTDFLKVEHDAGKRRLWYADEAQDAWLAYLQVHGKRGIDRLPLSERKKALA